MRELVLRKKDHVTVRKELRQERTAYSYMALATPLVFGAFGLLLGRRHERLRSAQEQINRMHEEFCAIAAHDLRNPITALQLRLETLRERMKDGSANLPAEALERLVTNTRRLDQLVSQLLDATRIDSRKLEIAAVPTALPECISPIVDRLRMTVGKHSLELAIEGAPPAVMADPSRLDQILTNLVDNAAKYSPDGTPIRIAIRPEQGGATLSVTDRGFGISKDELPHVFERFYQSSRARAKKSGLGLGLYITKGLVDAHGGKISVASQPNRGSTFAVWLPRATPG
ncbi:MAG: HAMP domain-containing histidine kinase [Kofleriaceae bacterium]|nr:HAMP domain-containing histidine kinase [Kofleriaceae bacterium]